MIIKDKTNEYYEKQKAIFGITGDIYVINGHLVESLEIHKLYILQHDEGSTAETIEEAEQERIEFDNYLREEAMKRALESEDFIDE